MVTVLLLAASAWQIACHMNIANSADHQHVSGRSDRWYKKWPVVQEWIEKKFTSHYSWFWTHRNFGCYWYMWQGVLVFTVMWFKACVQKKYCCCSYTQWSSSNASVSWKSGKLHTVCSEGVSSAWKWTVMIWCPGSRLPSGAADLHLEKTVWQATIKVDDNTPRWHKSTLHTSGILLGLTDV